MRFKEASLKYDLYSSSNPKNMISSDWIIGNHVLTPIGEVLMKARLMWFGHANGQVAEEDTQLEAAWKCPRGKPNIDWIDIICEDLDRFNQPLNELMEMARDRKTMETWNY